RARRPDARGEEDVDVAREEALFPLGLRDGFESDAAAQEQLNQPRPLHVFGPERLCGLTADEPQRAPLAHTLERLSHAPRKLRQRQLVGHGLFSFSPNHPSRKRDRRLPRLMQPRDVEPVVRDCKEPDRELVGHTQAKPVDGAAAILRESAFPVYVLHQAAIVLPGYFIIRLDLGIAAKFGLLLVVSLAITLATYQWLVRPFASRVFSSACGRRRARSASRSRCPPRPRLSCSPSSAQPSPPERRAPHPSESGTRRAARR